MTQQVTDITAKLQAMEKEAAALDGTVRDAVTGMSTALHQVQDLRRRALSLVHDMNVIEAGARDQVQRLAQSITPGA